MATQGRAKRYDGTAVDYVLLFDWLTGDRIGIATPDVSGNWSYAHSEDIHCGITYVADGCEPITHGPYNLESTVDLTINNIGVQGTAMFGVGITDNLPVGMSEMDGTTVVGHENYGNYQYIDGSVMCWIPRFYYRWGATDSPRAAKYGANACDVKSKHDFASVAAANAAGYALHRAFYDDGQIKDGFFVDKYLCSNNNATASSIKNGIPLSASQLNSPYSDLINSPPNNVGGAVDAVKTRGSEFFATTLFVQRALSLLSMAHAQAATNSADCAWYDASGVTNFPKGCNNNSLGDANDGAVKYSSASYQKSGRTGSASSFAKTTHNGQACGVADLNGTMYEACLGVTQLSGEFYVLKTLTKASALTNGVTATTDAWGATGIATNYEPLGGNIGALTGSSRSIDIGNGTQQVFSGATSGKEWQASCAGIPLSTGVSSSGTDLFGRDTFVDDRVDNLCPVSGGSWFFGESSGVWYFRCSYSQSDGSAYIGVRAALYGD